MEESKKHKTKQDYIMERIKKRKERPRRHPPGQDFAELTDNFDTDLELLRTAGMTKQYNELKADLLDFRGRILGLTCDVESQLDALLTRFFHPLIKKDKVTWTEDPLAALFEDLVMKQQQLNPKIRMLEAILEEVEHLRQLLPKDIVKRLDGIRELRNDLAHNPFNLKLIKKDEPRLEPLLCTRKKDIVVTEAYRLQKVRLCEEACNALIAALYKLTPLKLFR